MEKRLISENVYEDTKRLADKIAAASAAADRFRIGLDAMLLRKKMGEFPDDKPSK